MCDTSKANTSRPTGGHFQNAASAFFNSGRKMVFRRSQKFNMNLALGPLDFAVLFAVHHHS